MALKELNERDCLSIQSNGKDYNYDAKSKMAGQTYKRFNFDGKIFISDDANFYNEIVDGGIESLKLDMNDEGQLSLLSYITFKKLIGLKNNQMKLESITVENFKPSAKATVAEYEDLG